MTNAWPWPAICGGRGRPTCSRYFEISNRVAGGNYDHNPVALLRELLARALGSTRFRVGLVQSYQQRLPSTQGLYAASPQLGGEPRRGLGLAAGGVLLGRVRHPRIAADLLGRFGRVVRRPYQSSSDLGVPLIAVGLFYNQGYFRQHLDDDGYQCEEYIDTKVEDLPIKPAASSDGNPLTIAVPTRHGNILARVWQMHVGRVRLFLLDCDVEGNSGRRPRC